MNTRNLIQVGDEVKRLEKLVSDKEWEGQDPSYEIRELEHYRNLQRKGILWEPLF